MALQVISILPRIEISLSKIQQNCRVLYESMRQKGVSVTGVSKAVQGDPSVAEALISGGLETLADSRLENIERMRCAGVAADFVLLRTSPSQAAATVRLADISMNTELTTIRELSRHAVEQQKLHRFVVMVELGDLREGVLPADLVGFVQSTSSLPNVELAGLGTNLACFRGAPPSDGNMLQLSELVGIIEGEIGSRLAIVSGGNSANISWCQSTKNMHRINSLRLGESIFLGRETLQSNAIHGLEQRAFQLVAEVIESNIKPSRRIGNACKNAFGDKSGSAGVGNGARAIIALGRQDVDVDGLKSVRDYEILGASSDHSVLDTKGSRLAVGDEVRFDVDYSALLSAMSSRYVAKSYSFR